MDKAVVDSFLEKIGQIESAGGKYTNHVTLDRGMHKGQSAYGTWGLMPKTVQELARTSSLPEVKALLGQDEATVEAQLKANPDLERALASQLAEHVITRQGGDLQKAAYTWYNGHNLSPESVEKRGYLDHDYVKKFNKLAGLTGKGEFSPMASSGAPDARTIVGDSRAALAEQLAGVGVSAAPTTDITDIAKIFEAKTPVAEQKAPEPVMVRVPASVEAPPKFGQINALIAAFNQAKRK